MERFENSLEATREAIPEAAPRIAGPTDTTETESGSTSVGSEAPRIPSVTTKKRRTAVRPEGAEQATGTGETEGVKRSERVLFRPQMHENFVKALRAVIEAIKRGGDAAREAGTRPILLGRTPVVLRQVIAEDGSKPFKRSDAVVGQGSTIYFKGVNEHINSKHDAAIPISVLERLPALLADPVAVFKNGPDGQNPNGYRVLLDETVDGRPIVVALTPNVANPKLNGGQVNQQMTVYPTSWENVQAWSDAGALRYYNEESPRAKVVQRQLPETRNGDTVPTREGFEASLCAKKSPVKVMTRASISGLPKTAWSVSNAEIENSTTEAKLRAMLKPLFFGRTSSTARWWLSSREGVRDFVSTGFC